MSAALGKRPRREPPGDHIGSGHAPTRPGEHGEALNKAGPPPATVASSRAGGARASGCHESQFQAKVFAEESDCQWVDEKPVQRKNWHCSNSIGKLSWRHTLMLRCYIDLVRGAFT